MSPRPPSALLSPTHSNDEKPPPAGTDAPFQPPDTPNLTPEAMIPPEDFALRGSYVDMDDDDDELAADVSPHRSITDSVVASFRRWRPNSASSPRAKSPDIPPQLPPLPESTPDPSITEIRAAPLPPEPAASVLSRSAPDKEIFPTISFTFPQVSPPSSPPFAPRRLRPSLEGVFDTPSPRPRSSIPDTPPLEADSPRHSDASSGASSRHSRRPVPRGDNPLIFGNATPRRVSRSVPLKPSPPELDSGLRAPTLSVTSPTPQPSPAKDLPRPEEPLPSTSTLRPPTPQKSATPPKSTTPPKVTYQDDVKSSSSKGKGKRKSDELDKDADEERRIEKSGHSKRASFRISNTSSNVSYPPSAFNSSRRHSKRVKVSPESQTPSRNETAAAVDNSPDSRVTASSRPPSSHSRNSPRPRSFAFHSNSSRGSLPIRAIVSPRPPSVNTSYNYGRGDDGLYLRDPRKENRPVGWKVNYRRNKHPENVQNERGAGTWTEMRTSPTPAILFYPGFLLPFLWFIGAVLRNPTLLKTEHSDTREKWDQRRSELTRLYNLSFTTWRNRCRFMALVSLITYVPLVVLLAVFIPK